MVEMKRCYTCKTTKPCSAFGKQTRSKDGLRGECKDCRWSYQLLNLEKRREYKAKNAEHISAKTKEWRERNAEHIAAYDRRNRERDLAWNKAYRERNAEARKAYNREYSQKYPERLRANVVTRRARQQNSQPVCLNPSDKATIRRCYAVSRMFRDLFGIDAHVDHVLPLAGRDVCGLHVPWNLRIIDGTKNRQKAFHWSEDEALSPTGTFEVCV